MYTGPKVDRRRTAAGNSPGARLRLHHIEDIELSANRSGKCRAVIDVLVIDRAIWCGYDERGAAPSRIAATDRIADSGIQGRSICLHENAASELSLRIGVTRKLATIIPIVPNGRKTLHTCLLPRYLCRWTKESLIAALSFGDHYDGSCLESMIVSIRVVYEPLSTASYTP